MITPPQSITVYPGMSRDQVRALCGRPNRIFEAPRDGMEGWLYRNPAPWWRLRKPWVEFRFKRGVMVDDAHHVDSVGDLAVRYSKRALVLALALGLGLMGNIFNARKENRQLQAAREALRPGLTMNEIQQLFGKAIGSEGSNESARWTVKAHTVDQLLGGLYLVDGQIVWHPENLNTQMTIDFRNEEVVDWQE